MPIRQDDNRPNRRFGIINLVLIGFGVLLLLSSFVPNNAMQQVPKVPYSLFLDQVNDGAVKRAYITQEQIRYELSDPEEGTPPVLATTPIFDMDLPQRLETKGVEFAAAPPAVRSGRRQGWRLRARPRLPCDENVSELFRCRPPAR